MSWQDLKDKFWAFFHGPVIIEPKDEPEPDEEYRGQ